jgi:allophanate hydrolase subunit 2
VRAYLAVRGGFAVAPVLASAATDTLARVGPEPVVAGALLAVRPAPARGAAVSLAEAAPRALPAAGDITTLDIVMGPRTDWFTARGVAALADQLWEVTPQSNRVGMRLLGAEPLERIDAEELPSEGTATGAIQVPHSGQPVLFLADHPLTGGYPVIASVADHHLDLAAQIPVGAHIRFRPVTRFAEIAPGAPAPSASPEFRA